MTRYSTPYLAFLALGLSLLAGCNPELTESRLRDVLNVGPGRNENPLQQHGLANIFPDFDPARPVAEQWPHVAITVLKTPPFHAQNGADPRSACYNVGRTNYIGPSRYSDGAPGCSGCWTLKATVWQSAVRNEIKTFDWCFPRHANYLSSGAANHGFIRIAQARETSGVRFTEGPTPPEQIVPLDNAHRRFFQQSASVAIKAGDIMWFSTTMNGMMLENIGNQMGFGFSPEDPRLWIAGFAEAQQGRQ